VRGAIHIRHRQSAATITAATAGRLHQTSAATITAATAGLHHQTTAATTAITPIAATAAGNHVCI